MARSHVGYAPHAVTVPTGRVDSGDERSRCWPASFIRLSMSLKASILKALRQTPRARPPTKDEMQLTFIF